MEAAHDRTVRHRGAGLAGAKAAETLRAESDTARIVLIGQEEYRPYERPPLSKGQLLGTAPRDGAYVHDPDWYDKHDVELVTDPTERVARHPDVLLGRELLTDPSGRERR